VELASLEGIRSRRRMLKMECFRVCACGSVGTRDGGEDEEGEMRSVDPVGASPGASILEFVGTSAVPEVEATPSSGFAILNPPKDCDKLKSFCIASVARPSLQSWRFLCVVLYGMRRCGCFVARYRISLAARKLCPDHGLLKGERKVSDNVCCNAVFETNNGGETRVSFVYLISHMS